MDNQKKEENGREGRLPAMAPLANPYVPFQLENPPQYEAQKGLVRGTLFPGLDLPFMGMVNLNELPETPSSQMQALAFAVQELALYLDTHRDDREALELYRRYQQLLEKVPAEKREALIAVLAQDPRPSYQHDPDRVYGMSFSGMEIRFTVSEERLSVLSIEEK